MQKIRAKNSFQRAGHFCPFLKTFGVYPPLYPGFFVTGDSHDDFARQVQISNAKQEENIK